MDLCHVLYNRHINGTMRKKYPLNWTLGLLDFYEKSFKFDRLFGLSLNYIATRRFFCFR